MRSQPRGPRLPDATTSNTRFPLRRAAAASGGTGGLEISSHVFGSLSLSTKRVCGYEIVPGLRGEARVHGPRSFLRRRVLPGSVAANLTEAAVAALLREETALSGSVSVWVSSCM